MKTPRKRSLVSVLLAILLSASLSHAQQLITTVAGSTWAFPAGTLDPAKTQAPLGPVLGVAVATATAGLFQSGDIVISDFGNRRVFRVRGTALTLLAGNGVAGYSGDNGPAINAQLALPIGLAIDSSGNLYIADALNHSIRKVDTSGVITTIAGNGTPGSTGDGGTATNALLNFPTGVAVDSAGGIYIADQGNNRIRKVSAGTINPAAGTGTAGFANGAAGEATSVAQFNQPSGVAVDGANNVYIADTLNHRIRKLTVSTATVTTVAGNGTGSFSGDNGQATNASLKSPAGVAIDATNNLYIADTGNQRIRKVASGGNGTLEGTDTISTVAGSASYGFSGDTGSALTAALASPNGVALNAAGTTFYIADADNARLRTVTSGTIDTLAGNGKFKYEPPIPGDGGPALSASLNNPNSAAVDSSGNLYIADTGGHRIRKVTPTGTISTFAGTGTFGFAGDNGLASNALLNSPKGIAINTFPPIQLYIADAGNQRIRVVNLATNIITTLAGNGVAGFNGDGISPTLASLNNPSGVAVQNSTGDVYIADTNNQRVRKVSGGQIFTAAGDGTVGSSGDNGPATAAKLNTPVAVAIDAGNVNLYIADRNNHRIRKVTGGTITTVAGSGVRTASVDGNGLGGIDATDNLGDNGAATSATLSSPSGVAVDASGKVYIGDRDNFRVRKVSGGNISTVAGCCAVDPSAVPLIPTSITAGFSGDGGLSVAASLAGPTGLWLDAFGNLFVADSSNDRIRKLFSGQIVSGSAQGAPGAQVNVPITLALFGGATLDSVTFGVKVIPVTGPALAGSLSFVKDAALPAVTSSSPSGVDSISVSWLNQSVAPFPLGGTVKLGDVVVTIPGAALDGQTYTVRITLADGSLAGAPVPLSPGTDSTLTAAIGSYLVGDASPQLVNLNPGFDSDKNDPLEFGDGVPTILDLIDTLRAITLGGAFLPASCSARFDAMDSADAAGNAVDLSVNADHALTNFDLIVTLRRVTGIDATRPRRTATAAMLACSG